MDKFIYPLPVTKLLIFDIMANSYERKIPIMDCGHEYIRRILYGRWKIVLLLRIESGVCRPGELARSISQATRRVLDAQLIELLRHGIISRQVFEEPIQHVEYQLTELGKSLMPVINAMGQWGNDNAEQLKRSLK